MGFAKKMISSAVSFMTLGSVDLSGKSDAKVDDSAAQELKEEAKDTLKKRKALYATKGGVLGEEVEKIGSNYRGTIFGNK